jgi:hypothetical protein
MCSSVPLTNNIKESILSRNIYYYFRYAFLIRIKKVVSKKNLIYWCVAYLPSEASIIEH